MRYQWLKMVLVALTMACHSLLAAASVSLKLHLEEAFHPEVVYLKDPSLIDWIPPHEILHVCLSSGYSNNVQAYFALSISTPQGVLLQGQSKQFTLRPGSLHLINLDLIDRTSPYSLTTISVSALADDLMRAIKLNGYLPGGTYRLELELFHAGGGIPLATDDLCVEITNPFTGESIVAAESRQPQSVTDSLNSDAERITNALQKILGDEYLKVMKNLKIYQPTLTMRLNGEEITLEELEAVAIRFEEDACTIEKVSIR